jgi:hypothetical protein
VRLIGGLKGGLFSLAGGKYTRVEGAAVTGRVSSISDPDPKRGVWLVGTDTGLFSFVGGKLERVNGLVETGFISEIKDPDSGSGMRLIAAEKGLFNFADGRLTRVDSAVDTGEIWRISNPDPKRGGWLVDAENGLFSFADGKLTRVDSAVETGSISKITDADPRSGMRLVKAKNGLFSFAGDKLAHIDSGVRTGEIVAIRDVDPRSGVWLIVAMNGLFSFDGVKLTGFENAVKTGSIESIRSTDLNSGFWLFSFDDFLGVFADGKLTQVNKEIEIGEIGFITDPYPKSGMQLVGTSTGLFSFDGRKLARVESAVVTGSTRGATKLDRASGARIVVASNGLFEVALRPQVRGKLVENSGQTLRFNITGACAAWSTDHDFELHDANQSTIAATLRYSPTARELTATLEKPLVPGVPVKLTLAAAGAPGVFYPVAAPVKVQPPVDWLALSKVAFVAHALIAALLILLAGRSDLAAGLLMHPVLGWVVLHWGAAIWYLRPVQHWLLRRWFTRRKALLAKSALGELLPLPLVCDGKPEMRSTDLSRSLNSECRVWLIGNPGMGKTELARDIEADFFRHPTLDAAFKATGFIPLVVKLRGLTDPGKGDRRWPARVAEAVLVSHGWIADENDDKGRNASFVEAFLRRSGFVLLLDGANEVPWAEEIEKAVAAVKSPGFLVLSQQGPTLNVVPFETWRLPITIVDAVAPLLSLWLGEADGRAAYQRIAETPLLADIKSGYDVRLVESLHRNGAVDWPLDRKGLYGTILARLFIRDGDNGQTRLAAFAWALWLAGERQFDRDQLDESIRSALADDSTSVTRRVGSRIEFRHDQMRGYLAALHVAESANPIGVLAQSEAEWPQGKSEQDLVWQFLTELCDDIASESIYRWTLELPENRIRLQAAFQLRTARTRAA